MTTPLKFLQHYPATLQDKIRQLQARNMLGDYISQRYPEAHLIQTDKALYQYSNEIKQNFLRNAPMLDKVHYDNKLGIEHHALGLNKAISRVQGGKLKAKKEIKISAFFKTSPAEFLRMIVVHELAHLKEMNHSAKFWAIVERICPDYKVAEKELKAWSARLHQIG